MPSLRSLVFAYLCIVSAAVCFAFPIDVSQEIDEHPTTSPPHLNHTRFVEESVTLLDGLSDTEDSGETVNGLPLANRMDMEEEAETEQTAIEMENEECVEPTISVKCPNSSSKQLSE